MPRTEQMSVFLRPQTDEERWLPECPIGESAESDWLYYVCIQEGASATTGSLYRHHFATRSTERFRLPGRPGFVRPTGGDQVLVGMEQQLCLFDLHAKKLTPLVTINVQDERRVIINDGTVLDDGSVLFGTKDIEFSSPMAELLLYRKGVITTLRRRLTCSNGKALLDDSTILDIDTKAKSVEHLRLFQAPPSVAEAGKPIDFTCDEAFPDGMCGPIRRNGHTSVLIAMYNPHDRTHGEVREIDVETGEILTVWETPGSPRVTCPALVCVDHKVMLIATTATEGMTDEQRAMHTNAGCLFWAETDFTWNDVTAPNHFPLHG